MKLVSNITYPSTTKPGTSVSSYISQPISSNAPSVIADVLQNQLTALQNRFKNNVPAGLKITLELK